MAQPINIADFGARPDGPATDNTPFIQAAIDAAARSGRTGVYVPPAKDGWYRCAGGLVLGRTLRLYSEMPGDDNLGNYGARLVFDGAADAAIEVRSDRVEIEGLQLIAGSRVDKVIAIARHWCRVRNCYIGGKPQTAAIWLAGSLYTDITGNTITLQSEAAAIDAQDQNAVGDGVYYGTNVSWVRQNAIYVPGPAYIGTGIVDIIANSIESTRSAGGGKIVFAGSATFKAVVARNYFELALRSGEQEALKAIDVRLGMTLFCRENSFFGRRRPEDPGEPWRGSIAIDTRSGHVSGAIRDNHFTRWDTSVMARTPDRGRLELPGNVHTDVGEEIGPWFDPDRSSVVSTEGQHYRGTFEPAEAEQGPPEERRFGPGTVRRGWPDREIPVSLISSSAGRIRLAAGANWVIKEPTPPPRLIGGEEYSGLILTIRFQHEAMLMEQHGFVVARGGNVTVGPNVVLQFLIGEDGRAYEIGDTTSRSLPGP